MKDYDGLVLVAAILVCGLFAGVWLGFIAGIAIKVATWLQ